MHGYVLLLGSAGCAAGEKAREKLLSGGYGSTHSLSVSSASRCSLFMFNGGSLGSEVLQRAYMSRRRCIERHRSRQIAMYSELAASLAAWTCWKRIAMLVA